jgi:hypothetical protein
MRTFGTAGLRERRAPFIAQAQACCEATAEHVQLSQGHTTLDKLRGAAQGRWFKDQVNAAGLFLDGKKTPADIRVELRKVLQESGLRRRPCS